MSATWNFNLLITPLLASLAISATFAILLLLKSIIDFSHTGPAIRNEVSRHYSLYVSYALSRLTLWCLVLLFWMAIIGNLPYIALQIINSTEPSWFAVFCFASAGILIITILQFIHYLLHQPSSLMMSSHYKMTRLYPLWRLLSVSRIRWLRAAAISTVVLPIILAIMTLYGRGDIGGAFEFGAISLLICAPYLWATWQPCVRFSQAVKSQTPNILMIGSDTLRADRLGVNGNKRPLTPYLDALSKRSTTFTNCYVPVARTAPSLVSLFTGTWPQQHGVFTNFMSDDQTDLEVTTTAECMNRNGYETVTISDWAGSDFGKFTFGFRHVDVPSDQWNIKYLIRQGPKDIRLFLSLFTHNRFGKAFLPEIYYMAGTPLTSELGRTTRKWISKFAQQEQPFFLNVFMATTHPPFGSEYPYYDCFSQSDYVGESKFAMSRLTDPFEIIRSQREPKEAFDLDQILDLYDGSVRNFDDEVRRIMHHLKACKLLDNTIVVIYSDHGMDLFEHGTWGQGNSAIGDASARIPLIIFDPRREGRGTDSRIVRSIDVLPTLMELADLETLENIEGRSLVPYLDGNIEDMNLAGYFETGEWLATPPGTHPEHITYPDLLELLEVPDKNSGTLAIKKKYRKTVIKARDRMIRKGRWKLVRLALKSEPLYQLFDMHADPQCNHDVSLKNPDIVAHLANELQWWITSNAKTSEVYRAPADNCQ